MLKVGRFTDAKPRDKSVATEGDFDLPCPFKLDAIANLFEFEGGVFDEDRFLVGGGAMMLMVESETGCRKGTEVYGRVRKGNGRLRKGAERVRKGAERIRKGTERCGKGADRMLMAERATGCGKGT
jgi:hypothetical protein